MNSPVTLTFFAGRCSKIFSLKSNYLEDSQYEKKGEQFCLYYQEENNTNLIELITRLTQCAALAGAVPVRSNLIKTAGPARLERGA